FRATAGDLARSRDALQAQTRTLQMILDNMGDGVVVADENGTFVIFNPTAERILGVGATSARPEGWAETYGVFRPDGVTPFPADELPLTRAIRGEPSDQVEMFIRNPKVPDGVWI